MGLAQGREDPLDANHDSLDGALGHSDDDDAAGPPGRAWSGGPYGLELLAGQHGGVFHRGQDVLTAQLGVFG